MIRFQKINISKELLLDIEKTLKSIGYTELPNLNGGDNDFLVLDTLNKEYIWAENGCEVFSDLFYLDANTNDNLYQLFLKKHNLK